MNIVAVAIALVCTLVMADVTCVWVGDRYICSGEGGTVSIIGGGSGGGGSGVPVITNILGVCTNCSQIAPSELSRIASDIHAEAQNIEQLVLDITDSCEFLSEQLASNNQEIATYRNFGTSQTDAHSASNYMATTSNDQTEGMRYAFQRFVSENPNSILSARIRHISTAANAIYHYANNSVLPQNEASLDRITRIEGNARVIHEASVPSLENLADMLEAGAVVCGAGGTVTNGAGGPATGDWCTYDQGEAIKDLLDELKQYAREQQAKLSAISNYQAQTVAAIRSGLFTDYNAIPAQAQLGDWKQVYLDGAETNWGYAPTNILARIELLLYGLSGVGTNSTEFTDAGDAGSTEVMDDLEDQKDDTATQLRAMDTDASDTGARSLGQSITAFFRAFSPDTGSHQAGDVAIPSFSFNLGEKQYYVDALATPANVDALNTLRNMSSTMCGAAYLLASGWLVFIYWRWFAEKAVQMSRWAVELITSIFAS